MPTPSIRRDLLSRRQLLRAGVGAGGALLLARPAGVLAQPLPTIGLDAYGTARESRLFPGQFVVHADMHNHSLFSDGDGDPGTYYDLMRESGVDVAALTDHSTIQKGLPDSPCDGFGPFAKDCHGVAGIHDGSWTGTKELADAADDPGDFAAIAGFEWSSPTLGHMNVWFSREFADPLHTGGLGSVEDLLEFGRIEGVPVPQEVVEGLRTLVEQTPATGVGMAGWYQWLAQDPSTPGLNGGSDAIFGFNHPGREGARFNDFAFDERLVDRCVSMELFNKGDDYLFELTDRGRRSPLVECLDNGWRPGLLGSSDYHGTDWGTPDDRGRAGMYVTDLSRDSVRGAMEARRFYATRIKGVRLDATANGARMGTTLGHTAGTVTVRVDIDRGPAWYGRPLRLVLMGTGSTVPTRLHVEDVVVPSPEEPVLEFTVPVDVADTRWLVLRVTDPAEAPDGPTPEEWRADGRAIVYASPWFLDPDAVAGASLPAVPTSAAPDPAPVTTAAAGERALAATGGGAGAVGAAALALAGLVGFRGRQAHDDGDHHDHGDGEHQHAH